MSINLNHSLFNRFSWSAQLTFLGLLFSYSFSLHSQTYNVNINCGGAAYVSSSGVSFSADSLFNNGIVFSNTADTIAGTVDDILYQTERYDDNLAYSFNVPASGTYDVTLHFAEVFNKNQAINKRVFDLSLEGNLVLDDYDIYGSVGGYAPDIKNFQVSVTDGTLNLNCTSSINKAKLCAIQVKYLPSVCNDPNHIPTVDTVASTICTGDSLFLQGAYQIAAGFYADTLLNQNSCDSAVITDLQVIACTAPAFDFGINCGGDAYTDVNGFMYLKDTLHVNGSIFSNFIPTIANTSDQLLYQTERYQLDLAYSIPVPAHGEYLVELHFAEIFNKNFSVGKRVFDMSIEDSLVLDDYDIFADAGSNTASVKSFRINVQDGVLSITSSSSVNNAKLCAIRVTSAPVNCQLGPWGPWSSCDTSCGGGQQFRTRPVITAGANGGIPCGSTIEYRSCNTQACAVDCQVSAWSAWSACDTSCGGGQQFRSRTVITPASNGGAACPVLIEYQACNTQACAVNCQVSDWSAWSACDTSCGGGQQFRTRTVITPAANGGAACPNLIEYQACNTQACANNSQCPNDTVLSASATSCDAEVHFSLDQSGIKSSYGVANYANVPQNLNDCPKHANYGLSTLELTPTGISGYAMGMDVYLEKAYLKIDHDRIGDLVIDLESPNGTVVRLLERPGKIGLWGNGGCNADDMDAYFVPGTGNSAENDCSGNRPVLSGSYTAHDGHDLASLDDGSDPNGKWTLRVYDLRNKKSPKLRAWSLEFRSSAGSIIQISGLPSGASYPLGVTTNTLVFTDSLGNADTCSFNVTVEDTTAPKFDACPQEVLVCNDPVSWSAPTATDNCSAVTITQLSGPSSGSSLADGTYPVSYQAVDMAGNTSTCSFNLVKAPLGVDAGSDQVLYGGAGNGCTLLFGSVTNGQWPYTYSWSDGSSGIGAIVCPTTTTDYILTVTDSNGCSGTDTVTVEVIDVSCGSNKVLICYNDLSYCVNQWIAWYYSSFMGASYGGCSQSASKKMGNPAELSMVPPGLATYADDMLQAYPNPFNNSTTLGWVFTKGESLEIGLYDLTGRLVKEILSRENLPGEYQSMEVDASELPVGIYLVIAKTEYTTKTLRIHRQ